MPKTIRLWCAGGAHWWERPSQRGRRPISCPEHAHIEVAAAIPHGDEDIVAERVPADGQPHPLVLTTPQEEEELVSLSKALPSMVEEYYQTLSSACNARTVADTKHRFDVSDAIQNRIIGTRHRIKRLQSLVAS